MTKEECPKCCDCKYYYNREYGVYLCKAQGYGKCSKKYGSEYCLDLYEVNNDENQDGELSLSD